MSGCCEPSGYDLVFSPRQAQRDAARFRRSGLTWAPRRTVELYEDGTIGGDTVLEIGGGIGDLQVELLRAGVHSTTSVELSPAYEAAAAGLLREHHLAGRSTRRTGDFAANPGMTGTADIVVLHSVVCCYPGAGALVAAASGRATRYLVLSYPRETWWLRLWAPAQNLYPRLRGSDFRFCVHPERTIVRAAEDAGLTPVHTERNWVDVLTVFARPR